MKIKKIISLVLFGGAVWGMLIFSAQAQVQTGTVIPKLSASTDCTDIINTFNTKEAQNQIGKNLDTGQLIACGMQTGRISLPMIPYFITYFSNYLLGLVSLISLLFIVIGGLYYSFGGMSTAKDKGKTFIKNAIIGMVVAFLAWAIVNVIIAVITG